MILAAFVAGAMYASAIGSPALNVAVDRSGEPWHLSRSPSMSAEQKDAAISPLVSSATDCIAHAVSADPRFSPTAAAAEVNDLIVASVPSCTGALRSMIDAYDQLYGDGTGESFFMGPYLDRLPGAVTQRIKTIR